MFFLGKGEAIKASRQGWNCDKVLTMVLILDGNWEHIAHACRKIGLFEEEKSDLWLLSI